ncbi:MULTISPECIES: CmpA/NrtA family ABC transporter substrate-binding protein [unclassified Modicisalibacter]|uniref:CmpA/NrtA family ABC transporter substrate-binding protein n=1 Tax=unclassified Modicisalibacter TaxID=2679913 RepID=UPI001CCF9DA9|nr:MULTISPECIES: CmpA/NrtA family ABC transporter substrate-binding protein [unclassified Modicisalibacter]MBZ9560168.1 ABC transporter substrate-binding protein [Modicisalibacter sp. R2A 31.J]MBZ9576076.1 ABC transporter substrate-binding protein [Modicisalibacter sp. MOD 31.J]
MNAIPADGPFTAPERRQVTLGMLPLNDAAPLVVALEEGFFAEQGLEVTLVVESSWASLRDGLQLGLLDAAQMLALMPLASTLGLDGRPTPVLSALTLNLGGNAITVSPELHARLLDVAPHGLDAPLEQARALARVVAARQRAGEAPLRFANVYPFSSHRYLLRYWLAAGGIDPDRDLDLRVVPPPQMVSQLEAGRLDGYCVGEPWNRLAVSRGSGVVLCDSFAIWGASPEKVLGVREAWADRYPATHRALLRALLAACAWLDDTPAHRERAARRLCMGGYLDVSPLVVEEGLRLPTQTASSSGRTLFHRHAANFPWRSQTRWYAAQMQRWGHLDASLDLEVALAGCVRPDLYRQAADELALSCPLSDVKPGGEGAHAGPWTLPGSRGDIAMAADRFIDGEVFTA